MTRTGRSPKRTRDETGAPNSGGTRETCAVGAQEARSAGQSAAGDVQDDARPRGQKSHPVGKTSRYGDSPRVTEKQWSRQVEDLLHLFDWHTYHTFLSVRSTAGFPDIVALHPGSGRALVMELKGTGGRVTDAQQEWLDMFRACGIPAYAFWPHQLEQIVAVLRGAGGG